MNAKNIIRLALAGGGALTAVDTATSQISYDSTPLNYSQNFDSLGSSGTSM